MGIFMKSFATDRDKMLGLRPRSFPKSRVFEGQIEFVREHPFVGRPASEHVAKSNFDKGIAIANFGLGFQFLKNKIPRQNT